MRISDDVDLSKVDLENLAGLIRRDAEGLAPGSRRDAEINVALAMEALAHSRNLRLRSLAPAAVD
jgi:hypothetical protein